MIESGHDAATIAAVNHYAVRGDQLERRTQPKTTAEGKYQRWCVELLDRAAEAELRDPVPSPWTFRR